MRASIFQWVLPGLPLFVILIGGCAGGGGETRTGKTPGAPAAAPPTPTESAPKAAAAVSAEPVPAVPIAPGANPSWWIDGVQRSDGRRRVSARADADALVDARRLAVRAGTDALREGADAAPADLQTEKADLAHLEDGRWRVFVLMSCKE